MNFAIPAWPGPFTAWQLIGWEGHHGLLRRPRGRKSYCIVTHYCDTARSDNVRIVAPNQEGDSYVGPDTKLVISKLTSDGAIFLNEQGLITREDADRFAALAKTEGRA